MDTVRAKEIAVNGQLQATYLFAVRLKFAAILEANEAATDPM